MPYSFNLIDGSKMDFEYYCNYIGREKEEIESSIINKIEEIINTEMNGFDENEIKTYIDLTTSSFKNAFKNGNVVYTVTEEGKPAFVIDIQIPAGTGHFDRLIEI
jgi:hypothetical protein